jgi:hypothetical protein
MKLEWWEATLLLVLYLGQAVFANTAAQSPTLAYLAHHVRLWLTYVYFGWAAAALVTTIAKHGMPPAFRLFRATIREHF